MPSIQASDFSIVTDESAGTPRVKVSGNGDAEMVQPLDDYLVRLHGLLLANRSPGVVLDLTQLDFMNSSCIKAFASWVHDVKSSSEPYSIQVRLNPDLPWQTRTFKTLTRLAPSIVQVEEALI